MTKISIIFLIFIIYSFLGWCMEVIVTYPKTKKFVNRGFLIGPYCPIYGYGSLLMISLLSKYKDDTLVLIVMSTFICSVLEYFTSYIMEKIFKARWWDYSQKKFNINGRVCLSNALAFGIFGYLIVQIFTPRMINVLNTIPESTINILAVSTFTIYFIDTIISYIIMYKFKSKTYELKKDNTKEITEKVRREFLKGNYYTKRLVNAFPNVRETLKLKASEIEKKKQEAEQKFKERIAVVKKMVEVSTDEAELTLQQCADLVNEKREIIGKAINNQNFKNKKFKEEFFMKLHLHAERFKILKIKEKITKAISDAKTKTKK